MIERLDKAADPIDCGLAIAAETIEALRQLCQGIHLMIVGKEKDFAILERLSPKNEAKGV
jgi:5,10-methylenetetrahydrofolate reductase